MDLPEDINEWIVQRTRRDLRRITISVPSSPSPALLIARLRSIIPELSTTHPSVILDRVRNHGFLDLGTLDGRDAYRIASALKANGIDFSSVDASTTHLFPVNRVRGYATIIEDNCESEAFCRDLIARGAVIEEVEA
jgi:hypothetical protein